MGSSVLVKGSEDEPKRNKCVCEWIEWAETGPRCPKCLKPVNIMTGKHL